MSLNCSGSRPSKTIFLTLTLGSMTQSAILSSRTFESSRATRPRGWYSAPLLDARSHTIVTILPRSFSAAAT
ncbi:hypothetical protein F5883DRAFT_536963 [Diaporthe sp. PMI_573]|nr:hypothetical protein F5883DRAFT_536963 [Diaporthaceae sp. PMI_573]